MNAVASTTVRDERPEHQDAELPAPRVICTLGMHRSGTSLVSRVLNLLGVHLGTPELVSRTGEDNPKGYWEHQAVSLINDEILARFGGRWDRPPMFPPAWPRDPRLWDLRDKARQLLTRDFGAEPLWGWKDPRTCITMPFWQDLIGPLHSVICIRNPGEVVASLRSRNGMSPDQAERLWLAHVHASLIHTSGQARMLVFLEDLIDDWVPELRRLAAFIGHPDRGNDPRVQASVAAFIDKELCHHRTSMEELAGHQHMSFVSKGFYLALRGHARHAGSATSLELLATAALETWDRTAVAGVERATLAAESLARGATIHTLSAERNRLTAEVKALVQQVTSLAAESLARGATITTLSTERHRLAAEVKAIVQQVTSLAAERQSLAAWTTQLSQALAIAESDVRQVALERDAEARGHQIVRQTLQEIYASAAWRVVTFSRQLFVALFPDGTRRRRVCNSALRRIAPGAVVCRRPA